MIVEFDKSFEKSLNQISDQAIFKRLEKIIEKLENAKNITSVSNIKKLSGFKNYFRIRIGDYRLGIEKINDDTIRLIVVAHRKDIYKLFP